MLVVLSALLGLLIGLTAVPVGIAFSASNDPTTLNQAELTWFFGLVRVRREIEPGPTTKTITAERPASESRYSVSGPWLRSRIQNRAARKRLLRYLKDCRRALTKDNVHLRARVGLEDPADTGQLWALIGPANAWLSTLSRVEIDLQPDFEHPTLAYRVGGQIEFVPLRLLGLTLVLAFSPVLWR